MSEKHSSEVAVIGIDIGKNSFHLVGKNRRGALTLRQKWSRGQVEARLANLPPSARRGRAEKGDKSSIGPSRILGPKESFLFVPPEVIRRQAKNRVNLASSPCWNTASGKFGGDGVRRCDAARLDVSYHRGKRNGSGIGSLYPTLRPAAAASGVATIAA
jgi:hypothetical protein